MANYTVLSNPAKTTYYSPITYAVGVASPTADVNLQDYLDDYFADLIDTLYPVGSHYITTTADNPQVLFGRGVWSKIASGKTLLGANSTYALGSTGGESTHTLTINEMAGHTHNTAKVTHSRNGNNTGTNDHGRPSTDSGTYTGYTGGGAAHNNMQPYIKVIVWKRVS